MLARGALGVPRSTMMPLSQLARHLQRSLLTRNVARSPVARALSRAYLFTVAENRRSYATKAAATTPTKTVVKAVKANAKKPAKAAPKRMTSAKTKAKPRARKTTTRKAKPKPKPKPKLKLKPVKKPLTDEQKQRRKIVELRTKALKEPHSLRNLSPRLVFVGEHTRGSPAPGANAQTRLREANQKWRAITPAEREHYNHLAREKNEQRRAEYFAWVHSYTPEQIHEANKARAALRRLFRKPTNHSPSFARRITDDRYVKKPLSPWTAFTSERSASGDFKGIEKKEAFELIGKEWRALSEAEKQKYVTISEEDTERVKRERAANA